MDIGANRFVFVKTWLLHRFVVLHRLHVAHDHPPQHRNATIRGAEMFVAVIDDATLADHRIIVARLAPPFLVRPFVGLADQAALVDADRALIAMLPLRIDDVV